MAEKVDFPVQLKLILAKINVKRGKTYKFFNAKQYQCIDSTLQKDAGGNL